MATLTLVEQVHAGIKQGVDRHWFYTKSFSKVKPEYLMTVSVADSLQQNGYDSNHWMDFDLHLECGTERIKNMIFSKGKKFTTLLSIRKEHKNSISRRGRCDIFLHLKKGANENDEYSIIEIKNLDPDFSSEIKKELERLKEFLILNKGENDLVSCIIAFPSKYHSSLNKKVDDGIDKINSDSREFIRYELTRKLLVLDEDNGGVIHEEPIRTNEENIELTPFVFYTNTILMTKKFS